MTAPARPARTAADLLVDCLAAERCEWVFSVPGEETMDILDALSRTESVRHVTTRHEQGAAFMADVHGRLTGRAAVAMGTLGPGATNLVTGIADAYLDRAPMVAITGQASSDKLHKEAHQVVDIVDMFAPVTKWNTRVERVEAIPEIVRKAFRVATLEKPGPTHIELPENLAASPPEGGDEIGPLQPSKAYFPEPTDEAIAHAARLLAASERPIVLAGNGVLRRGAAPELRAFARGLHVPVAMTFMGKGAVDDRSHLSLMAVGLQTRDHVLSGFDRADLVVSVGYDPVEYAPSWWNPERTKRIIHIDTTPAEVDAAYRPEVELIGDIDGTLRRLLAAVLPHGIGGRDAGGAARGPRDPGPRRPAHLAARGARRVRGRPGLPDQAAARHRRPASRARAVGHRGVGRRRPQGLGRAALPGLRAEHRDHLERVRGDGHLASRRDRGQAGPPRPEGRRAVRRRRLPDEQPGARDRQADRRQRHGRDLARRRLRADRLEAAQRIRAAVRASNSATRTSSPTPNRSGWPASGRPPRTTSTRR